MTAIVDYRAGNLTSVKLAFDALGVEAVVTSDPAAVRAADRVVFPGVGAAASAMANLRSLGLEGAVREAATCGKPFLGICLGMQILFERSEEDGGVDTLGVLPGKVRRFPNVPGFKVPEIGWNDVQADGGCAMLKSGEEYYFVHSYYAELNPFTVGRTSYAGVEFTAAVGKGSLFATQFHPEKSGRVGLALLRRFLER
jgi:glutamine amidotransferase